VRVDHIARLLPAEYGRAVVLLAAILAGCKMAGSSVVEENMVEPNP
jgi:hypothetical protein